MSKAQAQKPKVGKSKDDFRQKHDKSFIVPKKLKEAIDRLGSQGWEYEAEFAKLAGVSQTDLGRFRTQFEDFIVMTPGHNAKRAWCGSVEFAAELREML